MTDTLYSKVAKLAQTNPELRVHLVPLLKKHASESMLLHTKMGDMEYHGPVTNPSSVILIDGVAGDVRNAAMQLEDSLVNVSFEDNGLKSMLSKCSSNHPELSAGLGRQLDRVEKSLTPSRKNPAVRKALTDIKALFELQRDVWIEADRAAMRKAKTADTSLTGKTIEGPHLRCHVYRSSYRVWGLENAGKRGKTVPVFALYDIDEIRDEDLLLQVEQLGFRMKNMKYEDALDKARDLSIYAKQHGLSSPKLEEHQERGVDVMPAGFDTIKLKTQFVELEASYDSFRLQDRGDRNNLPTCIPAIRGGKASIPVFYRWVLDNQTRIPNLKYYEILSAMQTLGIKYHDYCAMD